MRQGTINKLVEVLKDYGGFCDDGHADTARAINEIAEILGVRGSVKACPESRCIGGWIHCHHCPPEKHADCDGTGVMPV